MANFPNITQTEMAVLTAAVLLLFVAPAVLSWADERRRRRLQRAAIAAEALRVASPVESAGSLPDAPAVAPAPPETLQHGDTAFVPAADAVAAVLTGESGSMPAPPAPVVDAAAVAGTAPAALPPELQPLSGTPRHRFRLDDLHNAQLSDWPPAAIRNDPERSSRRQEAEQGAEPYQTLIREALLLSPYPARSYCLGTADADASELRLSFLLFPVVWPMSQNQAVAQAVFRIDRLAGELRGWVDALRPQELSEENRREIHEAGGEV
jgi:hypothetical protein